MGGVYRTAAVAGSTVRRARRGRLTGVLKSGALRCAVGTGMMLEDASVVVYHKQEAARASLHEQTRSRPNGKRAGRLAKAEIRDARDRGVEGVQTWGWGRLLEETGRVAEAREVEAWAHWFVTMPPVNGLIATTDFDWYRHLSSLPDVDEVNFWQPSSYREIHSIQRGEPLLFKLKAPHNAICGFGLFAGGSELEASLAWDAFGEKNGVRSLEELIARVAKYRAEPLQPGEDPKIGCQMVGQPVFFERPDWIPQPADWSRNIVSGKTYDLAAGEGARVWRACLARAGATPIVAEPAAGYGKPRLIEPRIGQGIFRVHVTDAWSRACAITGEHSLPVLEAAHIVPFEKSQSHRVSNGLLLRADIHKLFDKGYVTVTPDLVFRVSPRLRTDWKNGKAYYPLDGTDITSRIPISKSERPDPSGLAWHNAHVFKPAAS